MKENELTRGTIREASIPEEDYFSESYFALTQLFTQAYQIHAIASMRPASVLEIGIGNGFVSSFLRRAGFRVTTVDINPNLKPDFVSDVLNLRDVLKGEKYDLIVACEVLEHIPFDRFDSCVEEFKKVASNCFLTLPDARIGIGFGGYLRLPKLKNTFIHLYLRIIKKRKLTEQHFWEIGFTRETRIRNIRSILQNHFSSVESGTIVVNPYHRFFVCKSSNANR